MTDRLTATARIDRAHARVDALTALLAIRARDDLQAAVLPGQSYDPPVSGSGGSTVTEQGLDRLGHAATYEKVAHGLEKIVKSLTELHNDVTPTGKSCQSRSRDANTGRLVECERMASTRGFCDKCWPHVRQGHPPDAGLLRDWNGRLERDCGCESSACEHPAGRCTSRIKPGQQARQCDKCRQRMSRARRQSDGMHPWQWRDAV